MNVDRLRGLSLFSGIGGIDLALEEYVQPIAYCENDKYAQGVLLSRMREGKISVAPIWSDVKSLSGEYLPKIDIIYGGFPCQDISVAGAGKGLGGERSGLFFEISRLAQEIKPRFLFLENVPAIRTRGLSRVAEELADIGYDCRWGALSAYDVGAPHKRERWFCLAYARSQRRQQITGSSSSHEGQDARRGSQKDYVVERDGQGDRKKTLANTSSVRRSKGWSESTRKQGRPESTGSSDPMADTNGPRLERRVQPGGGNPDQQYPWEGGRTFPEAWESDAGILRVAHGISQRVDRIRCCGNSVVPLQAKEAFERLMGLK